MKNGDGFILDVSVTKETLGREIITGTLDALNSSTYGGKSSGAGSSQDMSDSYKFQRSVLDAAYSDKGAAVSKKG